VKGNPDPSAILSLVDMALVDGLGIMVMPNGYGIPVFVIDREQGQEIPPWLGKFHSGSL